MQYNWCCTIRCCCEPTPSRILCVTVFFTTLSNLQVGSLVCISRTGARFKVGSGLTDKMRGHRQAPAAGTVITFKYFELTKDGIPRFPTFLRIRPDVDASEFPSV